MGDWQQVEWALDPYWHVVGVDLGTKGRMALCGQRCPPVTVGYLTRPTCPKCLEVAIKTRGGLI